MKKILTLLLGSVLLIFFIWFLLYIFSVVQQGSNGQLCRLNERIKAKSTVGVVETFYIPEFSKGGVVFVLKDGSKHTYSKSAFKGQLSNILKGDSITKPIGSLVLTVKSKKKSFNVSLDKGCN